MVTKMSDLIDRNDAIMAVKAGALSAATLFGRSDAGMTALRDTVRAINSLPSAQPETHDKRTETHGVCLDAISRQAAIDALIDDLSYYGSNDERAFGMSRAIGIVEKLPPAHPTRLSYGDINTIKIEMTALKEQLYNRGRFKEALEYQKIIERFLESVLEESQIIRCKDCKHYYFADNRIPQEVRYTCDIDGDRWSPDSYCSFAERKDDE